MASAYRWGSWGSDKEINFQHINADGTRLRELQAVLLTLQRRSGFSLPCPIVISWSAWLCQGIMAKLEWKMQELTDFQNGFTYRNLRGHLWLEDLALSVWKPWTETNVQKQDLPLAPGEKPFPHGESLMVSPWLVITKRCTNLVIHTLDLNVHVN